MLHLNLPTLGTKIKHVIVQWIALLIVEDGKCSLTFAKVTTQISSRWRLNRHVLRTHQIRAIVPMIRSQKRGV